MKQSVNTSHSRSGYNAHRPAKYAGLQRMAGDIRHAPTRRIFKQPNSTQKIASSDQKPAIHPRPSRPERKRMAKPSGYTYAAQAVTQSTAGSTRYDPPTMLVSSMNTGMSAVRKLMYGFACLVLVLSLTATIQTLLINNEATDQIATLAAVTQEPDEQGVAEGTGSDPAEQPVDASTILDYQVVNPEHPRYLRIPSLDVFARIKNTGVDSSGAVDAPWNIHDVSWFNESARPGSSRGASLLLGHVSGWSGPGVFKEINRLNAGMQFSIEKGSGEIIEYEVVRGEEIPLEQVDMAKILNTEPQMEHDLKLMTCSGKYNSETETFESRYVVYAKRII